MLNKDIVELVISTVLGLPATSAAAELKFSIAGTLIAADRSKLNPEKTKRAFFAKFLNVWYEETFFFETHGSPEQLSIYNF